jgi:putative transcriptional regulator
MVLWNVRQIAEARGIKTATELGERVKVNINTATALWNGRSVRVDRTTLNKLCAELGCTPGDLLVYDPSKIESPSLVAA